MNNKTINSEAQILIDSIFLNGGEYLPPTDFTGAELQDYAFKSLGVFIDLATCDSILNNLKNN